MSNKWLIGLAVLLAVALTVAIIIAATSQPTSPTAAGGGLGGTEDTQGRIYAIGTSLTGLVSGIAGAVH